MPGGGVVLYVGELQELRVSGGQVLTRTSYYYHGGVRVGMRAGGVLYYLHTDHLGSVTLTTGENKAVVARRLYRPYGETRYVTGTLTTAYAFTGQMDDYYIKLIHMGARWYNVQLGRWISPDTIVPDPANPQSLNRYSYVHNRPLVFLDQGGHFPWPVVIVPLVAVGGVVIGGAIALAVIPDIAPWDPPTMVTHRVADPITSSDMTEWLRNQMVTNAQSDVVRAIHKNWASGDPLRMDAAMQAWTALVGTDATWDFKYDIRRTEWFGEGRRDVTLGNRQLNFDAVANIHFGFVGRAAGFDAEFLVVAAGFAQGKQWLESHDPNDRGVCNTACYCDHPFAAWSVRFGSYLYEFYGDRWSELDYAAFTSALEAYIAQYGEPPDPPPGAVAP